MIKEQRQGDQDPYHIIPRITLQHTNYTKGLTHNSDLKMTVLLPLQDIYIYIFRSTAYQRQELRRQQVC